MVFVLLGLLGYCVNFHTIEIISNEPQSLGDNNISNKKLFSRE